MAQGTQKKGKYFLLDVPDDSGEASSYLRLGTIDFTVAGDAGAPPSTGEDLAAKVTSFEDDTRERGGAPNSLSPGARQAESAKLHTKGGWRDHTEGNRITTTRGDKVEVIQGNYTLLICGRNDDEAIWDVSGGHVFQNDITFGGGTKFEWSEDYAGCWKVTETTIKGDVDTTYLGDTIDKYYGKRQESITGSETPGAVSDGVPDEGVPYTYNPAIVDRTWAQSITSYTGSAALRIPSIKDETWAGDITSSTHAGSITEETTVDGAIRSKTQASTISDETTAEKMVSTTRAEVEDTMYGNTHTETFGNSLNTTHGFDLTTVFGITNEIMLGGSNEITVGEQVQLMVGLALDLTLAGKLEIDVGGSCNISIGPDVDLVESYLKMVGAETTVSLATDDVDGSHSIIAALINLA
jgi:hypothetical protein